MGSYVTRGAPERQSTEHSAWYPSALQTPAGSMAVTNHPHWEILLASLQAEISRGASHPFEDPADAQVHTPSLNISTEDWPGTGLSQAPETHCSLWLTDA